MSCFFTHRYGAQETVAARLPVYDDSENVMGNTPEVTVYRQTCSKCGARRAWCVTLDNQYMELNPDDRRVKAAFNKEH